MKLWLKRIGIGLGALVVAVVLALGTFVYVQTSAFDESMDCVYDLPLPKVERTTDPLMLARGKHLAESVMPCLTSGCHGTDLGGGKTESIGPIGTMSGPNISAGGLGAAYSDGELARLLGYGVKKDGRGVRMMPTHESNWLPPDDIAAIISYLRTLPPVSRPNGPNEFSMLGKVLDCLDKIPIDIARRVDHAQVGKGPKPSPTAAYGAFVARLCQGCHGQKLSGGPIPGGPPDFLPANLTPHESGLKTWTYEDFVKSLVKGVRKDGTKLGPMMPIDAFGKLDGTEKQALWAYLRTVPATPYGNR